MLKKLLVCTALSTLLINQLNSMDQWCQSDDYNCNSVTQFANVTWGNQHFQHDQQTSKAIKNVVKMIQTTCQPIPGLPKNKIQLAEFLEKNFKPLILTELTLPSQETNDSDDLKLFINEYYINDNQI
jgi:hypothetical protein